MTDLEQPDYAVFRVNSTPRPMGIVTVSTSLLDRNMAWYADRSCEITLSARMSPPGRTRPATASK